MIFPKEIKKGDTIGIISPSSAFTEKTYDEVKKSIEDMGFNVKIGESCKGSYKGYLSAPDEIRAKDIEDMFLDKSVDAIFCMRGGYGAPRILDMIDYNIIKENPKAFVGFSDITALHLAFNQIANLSTYHGIMAGTSYKWDDFTKKSLFDALEYEELNIENPKGEEIITLVNGECEGVITGGNLALIADTMGTKYEIDTKNKVLFIEEVGEPIYNIDRMLTQLALAGKFEDCAGIILGDFSDCNKQGEEEFNLQEILEDRISKFKKPCIFNLKSGHCFPMITLPLGAVCKLDATNKTVKIIKK